MISASDTSILGELPDLDEKKTNFRSKLLVGLSPARISAVYVLIVIIVVFSLKAPHTFPTTGTVKQVLNTYSITALAALALVIPLSAGVFDVSVPYTMTLSGIISAYLTVHTGIPVAICMVVGVLVGLVVGAVNSVIVVVVGIESLIATLAMGAVIQAVGTMFTNSTPITGIKLSQGFSRFAGASLGSVTIPVLYMLIIAVVIYYIQEHTATGRRLVSVGFNVRAAKLASVRADRLRTGSLLASGVIAAFAGVVLASSIASGEPGVGTPYLLPAFAGVFLGATQLREGRFNAFGTVLAILMIGTGVIGLQLINAASWAGDLFTGLVLIVALTITRREQLLQARGRGRRRRGLVASSGPAKEED